MIVRCIWPKTFTFSCHYLVLIGWLHFVLQLFFVKNLRGMIWSVFVFLLLLLLSPPKLSTQTFLLHPSIHAYTLTSTTESSRWRQPRTYRQDSGYFTTLFSEICKGLATLSYEQKKQRDLPKISQLINGGTKWKTQASYLIVKSLWEKTHKDC